MQNPRQVGVRVFLILGLCILFPLGCRKPPPSVDTVRLFQPAIEHYLAQHGMGLRVAAFRKLEVQGGHARAQVSLRDAEGVVGVKVRWTFELEKRSGHWITVSHRER